MPRGGRSPPYPMPSAVWGPAPGPGSPRLFHSAAQPLDVEDEAVSDGEPQLHQPTAGGFDRELGGVAAPVDGKAPLIACDRLAPRSRRLHGHGSDRDHATSGIEKRHIEWNRTAAHHHPKWIRSGKDEEHAAMARDEPATAEPAQTHARLEGEFQLKELVCDLDPGGFERGGRGRRDLGLPAGAPHQ